ncbi:MAG: hypothetical protein NT150_15325 [Bacteroidetes bacterium]|nr:hypothetical protein [Bacteroidota bacterium]
MENKNEQEIKKVWVKPEVKVEEVDVTNGGGPGLREGGTYRS